LSRTTPQSLGPLAYAYAYAYAYTGAQAYTAGNAYAHGAPMEAYGFDGLPGNPMLAAALQATRSELRRDLFTGGLGGAGDVGALRAPGTLPPLAPATSIPRYGAQVRASMALMELLGSVQFRLDAASGAAALHARCAAGPGGGGALLARMTRPTRAFLDAQLALTDSWASARDARLPQVLTQVAPPLAQFASVLNLQTARHGRTLELLNVALQFAYAVCMHFKHALACPRPSELSAGLMPVLEVPPHPALPAGHANEATVSVELLSALAGLTAGGDARMLLRRVAWRIAENRVVAGVHYPIDNVAGRMLGDSLASYLLAAAGAAPSWSGGCFDGARLGPEQPAHMQEVDEASAAADGRSSGPGCTALEAATAPAADGLSVWREMWTLARKEWE
jgi:membrane-associated phospholipid phosphatase